jgi:hypothetical protein
MLNLWKWSFFIGHPSGPSAELKSGSRTAEHPSQHNAERVMLISPRGEMGQLRSALGSEGCLVVPENKPKKGLRLL